MLNQLWMAWLGLVAWPQERDVLLGRLRKLQTRVWWLEAQNFAMRSGASKEGQTPTARRMGVLAGHLFEVPITDPAVIEAIFEGDFEAEARRAL